MKLFTVRASAALLAAALIVISAACGALCGGIAAAHTAEAQVIVIDAGQGGIDAGVRGKNSGVKEGDLNLAVAKELRARFVQAGFVCVMTRKSQAGLYGLPTKGFKLRDMNERRQVIEDCGAAMVISVHQNFYSDPTRRGAQVFFDGGSEAGRRLAACVQSSLNSMPDAVKKTSPLAGDYYMLRCTDSPSVIVECGFLSNPQDEELLLNEKYRKELASAIFAGAVSYYSKL